MYAARYNRVNDPAVMKDLIRRYGFATIVSFDGSRSVATHVPLQLFEHGETLVLKGHLAKANPQWRHWAEREVLVIFQGPDAYISPTWYDHVNVPTWNYAAVHAYGTVRLIDDPAELLAMLKDITDRYESVRGNRYKAESLPRDFYEKEVRALVGFAITITSMEASLKLSQNRHAADYDHIIEKLNESGDPDAQAVSELMKSHNPHR